MKNLFNSFVLMAFVAIMFSSCSDDGDPVVPDPGTGTSDHTVLWSYDMGTGNLADILPAIDDNDNAFFTIVNDDYTKVIAIGLDKNGNELWKHELDGTVTGKTMVANGKVIMSTGYPTAIYCLDAASGNTEWSKNLTADYEFFDNPVLAFANNKIYAHSNTNFDGYILTYDLAGIELSNQISPVGFNLSVYDNALIFHDMDSVYSYMDGGSGITLNWKWKIPSVKNNRTLLTLYDIPLGDDGSIYIRDDYAIYILSQSGQLVKTINLDATFYQGYNSNLAITNNGDMILAKGDLVKFGLDGNMEWESDINDGAFINPSFSSAPVISSNDRLYDAQLFGLYSVKSNGSLNWKENAETGASTDYGNLHPPVLLHDGSILSVSSEASAVRCFKGDGQGLATGGWPKPYGDYGNTSSK